MAQATAAWPKMCPRAWGSAEEVAEHSVCKLRERKHPCGRGIAAPGRSEDTHCRPHGAEASEDTLVLATSSANGMSTLGKRGNSST